MDNIEYLVEKSHLNNL